MFHDGLYGHYLALPTAAQLLMRGVTFAVLAWILVTAVRGIVMGRVKSSRYVDDTLGAFMDNLVAAAGWIVIITVALVGFGIPASALIGLLAVGGFIIGFALKDTLGNLAAGVVLLLNRPYNVGEGVQVKGHDGTVTNLGISMTTLKTFDGRMVTVPNGAVLGDAILNHSRNPIRRAEVSVGIGYGDDIEKGIRTAMKVLEDHDEVLADPAPQVLVVGLGDSSINLSVRAWVNTPDYMRLWTELNHRIKVAMDDAGIEIPFPQRDVHIYHEGGRDDAADRPRDEMPPATAPSG